MQVDYTNLQLQQPAVLYSLAGQSADPTDTWKILHPCHWRLQYQFLYIHPLATHAKMGHATLIPEYGKGSAQQMRRRRFQTH